jgi:hypothetical protein
MRLADFIEQNMEAVVAEWGAFAQTRIPAAATMTTREVRNHAQEMLVAIAKDLRHGQSEGQRSRKSRGLADALPEERTAASAHGLFRHLSGFDLIQVASEFRALRATVLRLWKDKAGVLDAAALEDVTRFNESIDQSLAESIASYSAKIDESRDTFLAILGHDLRGPLASLSNCIELQADPLQSPALRDRTAHIAWRSVQSMTEILTDLFEYTRTRLGGGVEVLPEPGDIGEFCEECLEQTRAAYPKLRFKFSRSGKLWAQFDSARIRQVLTNLLTNAVQHGDRTSPIHFTVERDSSHIRMVVRNQGAVIPPDALQVIFNPLVQVAQSESEPHERPTTSLGLGLFIAREIAAAHGGSISVTSTHDAGTTFTVRLPRAAD